MAKSKPRYFLFVSDSGIVEKRGRKPLDIDLWQFEVDKYTWKRYKAGDLIAFSDVPVHSQGEWSKRKSH